MNMGTQADETAVNEPLGPKYDVGDLLVIPVHNGNAVGEVIKVYEDYYAAQKNYELSFKTILKKGPNYDDHTPHYLCQINNSTRAPIGVCEPDAKLKRKGADPLAEGKKKKAEEQAMTRGRAAKPTPPRA